MKPAVLFSLLAAFIIPKELLAEPIAVTSGEHDTFTRLVLPLPQDVEWQLEQSEGRSKIMLAGFDDGFDLNAAFNVIPRTRLSALLARSSELELQLACACQVTAFFEQNGFLVIDISDPPEDVAAEPPVAPSAPLPVSQYSYGELLWRNELSRSVQPDAKEPESIGTEPDRITEPVGTVERELVLETQTRLLEAFADAASRGVLDPVQPLNDAVRRDEETSRDAAIFDSSELLPGPRDQAKDHIRVTNSRDVPEASEIENLAVSGISCPDPNMVNVASWGSDLSFSAHLGQLNHELVDDLGRVDRRKAEELAKFYIYYGFGAEARMALSLAPENEQRFPELTDIADILEYRTAPNARGLRRFADCDSALALWGILAVEEVPADNPINAKAALRALQELPSHLKYFLAQELSNRFLARGDLDHAKLAMRSYQSLPENAEKEPKIGEAQALILQGDEETADDVLNEIISDDAADAPEAIVALIEQKVGNNEPVPADIALLAEAYAFELKGGPSEPALFRAFVLASAKSGQFAKSFTALNTPPVDLSRATQSELNSILFHEIAKAAEDYEFLSWIFGNYASAQSQIDSSTKVELSERLLFLGFPEKALEVANDIPASFRSEKASIFRAKLFLENGLYEEALQALELVSGSNAVLLRAEIFEKMGDFRTAADFFAMAAMPERASDNLVRAEEWSELGDKGTPALQILAQIKSEAAIEIEDYDTMLSQSRVAIEASASARSTMETALQDLQLTSE